jgi:hypothetical protein
VLSCAEYVFTTDRQGSSTRHLKSAGLAIRGIVCRGKLNLFRHPLAGGTSIRVIYATLTSTYSDRDRCAAREVGMGTIVATQFYAGGKSITRQELDQICQILDIQDPLKQLLPTGANCTYYLLLSSNAPLPKDCADLSRPLLKLLKKGSDAPPN